jgi:hypothetical protein
MAFTLKTLNGFEMLRRAAAAEIPTSILGHRAFVGVYPPLPEKGIPKWRIRRFAIPEHLLDQYFAESDLVNSEFVRVDTLDDVESLLAKWGIDSTILDAPWKCDWPL